MGRPSHSFAAAGGGGGRPDDDEPIDAGAGGPAPPLFTASDAVAGERVGFEKPKRPARRIKCTPHIGAKNATPGGEARRAGWPAPTRARAAG